MKIGVFHQACQKENKTEVILVTETIMIYFWSFGAIYNTLQTADMTMQAGSIFSRLFIPFGFILSGIAIFVSLEGCNMPQQDAEDTSVSEPVETESRIAIDVGVVVSDMESSLAFYRDLLGLPVIAEVRTSLIGKGTMIQLKHGESLIKLLQMDEPPTASTETGIATTFGHRYITLMVEDITSFASAVQGAETPVSMPLTELGNGAQIMMVEDPDGNIVEFVQEATP